MTFDFSELLSRVLPKTVFEGAHGHTFSTREQAAMSMLRASLEKRWGELIEPERIIADRSYHPGPYAYRYCPPDFHAVCKLVRTDPGLFEDIIELTRQGLKL